MKTCIILFLSVAFLPFLTFAETDEDKVDKRIRKVNSQIERLSYEVDLNTKDITEKNREAFNRIEVNSQDIKEMEAFKNDLNSKVIQVETVGKEISELNSNYQKVITSLASLNQKMIDIEKKHVELKNDMSISQGVITWVTAIVSIVVVLIGLFFSKRFLELYSNYKVIRTQFSKEQRESLGLDSDT